MTSSIRAVCFDIGGVVVKSPLIAIAGYEKEIGLPQNYLNVQISSRGRTGAWQRFERGEIPHILDFYADFGRELSDTTHGNPAYVDYATKNGLDQISLPESVNVNGRELFGRMMRESATYDPIVVSAIARIRESKLFLLIAITNNFVAPYNDLVALSRESSQSPSSSLSITSLSASTTTKSTFDPLSELSFLSWTDSPVPTSLRDKFDVFIDSSEVGMRKPESGIFELAISEGRKLLEKNEGTLKANECVMIDDLRMNLKAARELGMSTVHVPIGESRNAMQELEGLLGISLLDNSARL